MSGNPKDICDDSEPAEEGACGGVASSSRENENTNNSLLPSVPATVGSSKPAFTEDVIVTNNASQGGTETNRQSTQTSERQDMALPYSEIEMDQDLQGNHRAPTTGYNINYSKVNERPSICAYILTAVSFLLIVVQEYERAVIFRLGRLLRGGAKGPGIFFIIPCIDTYCKVDLRTVSFDVPPQEILSRDSVTVAVDAVVYYRISNATIAISNVEDYGHSTRLLAATTLRNVLGTKNLSEILSERESISHVMQASLDEATDPWGVKVERVEIKDVRLPVQLQRAMAAEAEATREARAKVIAAEGEQRASRALKEASEVIADSSALQLRYLQTLGSIATEKNSTIVFPIPLELFRGFLKKDV
ncbi:band 7 protein AGAP004871-like [Limulus polyphemus]|uniref:Band 7 protein AGAP004871-like n=1 Tax=Limulus polyphemus TaxID=6850 RepID=A0ABM1BWR8_LIMPO|nr:band 7 protein AGAP004871-like [Limulus polyphemus]